MRTFLADSNGNLPSNFNNIAKQGTPPVGVMPDGSLIVTIKEDFTGGGGGGGTGTKLTGLNPLLTGAITALDTILSAFGRVANALATLAFKTVGVYTPEMYGAVGNGTTDDTTACQSAMTAAVAAHGIFRMGYGKCYKLTDTITVTGPVTVEGGGTWGNYGDPNVVYDCAVEYPAYTPYLYGSVFKVCTAAKDALKITCQGTAVHLRDFGVVFDISTAIAFQNTGHGIWAQAANDISGRPNFGMMSGSIRNVFVWGVDGNHYEFKIVNAALCVYDNIQGWGGGGLQLLADTLFAAPGNSVINAPYFCLLAGGTSDGINVSHTSGSVHQNLLTFIRPQVNSMDIRTIWPALTPVHSVNQKLMNFSPLDCVSLTLNGPDCESGLVQYSSGALEIGRTYVVTNAGGASTDFSANGGPGVGAVTVGASWTGAGGTAVVWNGAVIRQSGVLFTWTVAQGALITPGGGVNFMQVGSPLYADNGFYIGANGSPITKHNEFSADVTIADKARTAFTIPITAGGFAAAPDTMELTLKKYGTDSLYKDLAPPVYDAGGSSSSAAKIHLQSRSGKRLSGTVTVLAKAKAATVTVVSATNVASYHPDVDAFAAYLLANQSLTMTDAQKLALDTFITDMDYDGLWKNREVFCPLSVIGGSGAVPATTPYWLKTVLADAILISGATWAAAQGVQCASATSRFIKIPTTGVLWDKNEDVHIFLKSHMAAAVALYDAIFAMAKTSQAPENSDSGIRWNYNGYGAGGASQLYRKNSVRFAPTWASFDPTTHGVVNCCISLMRDGTMTLRSKEEAVEVAVASFDTYVAAPDWMTLGGCYDASNTSTIPSDQIAMGVYVLRQSNLTPQQKITILTRMDALVP